MSTVHMLDITATSTYTVSSGRANDHRTWSSTVVTVNWRCIIFISSLCHRWTTAGLVQSLCLLHSISLWTQITLPMCHTWEPADSSFKRKNIPCFTKANCLCERIHAGGVLFHAMWTYKKSQTINIYVQPYRGVKKIYSQAEQYAKITYKMSLSLSKILSIEGFS